MSDSDRDVAFPVREFCTSRRVEFADTDMGGIVHFLAFFSSSWKPPSTSFCGHPGRRGPHDPR